MRKTSKSNKQQCSIKTENAMYYFATLMAVNTACYALCNILMIKIIEFQPVSLLLLIATLTVAFRSIAVRKKLYANFYTMVTLAGIVLCVLQALGILPYMCLPVNTTLTADSLLFTATYIISDVFSEVFGYRASRMSNIIAAVFALTVNYIAKSLTYVKGPSYAVENDSAFQFIFGGGFYVVTLSVIIYMCGDFVNDKVFQKIKSKQDSNRYNSYCYRTIASSLAGKALDIGLFSVCVFVPFSNDTFCKTLNIDSWNMTVDAIIGNFVFGVTLQILTEILVTPVSYRLCQIMRRKMGNGKEYIHENL